MSTWQSPEPPDERLPGPLGLVLALARLSALATLILGVLGPYLLLRAVEPAGRPLSPALRQMVCRGGLVLLGVSLRVEGRDAGLPGLIAANHAGWLDIFVLGSVSPAVFVAKSEVARWPGIGQLARATGTVFIARRPRDAAAQKATLAARISAGDRLILFPEGTSTDGLHVLRFKSTLFAAVLGAGAGLWVQPVSIVYAAPRGREARFLGWWGEMDFARHLLRVAACPRRGRAVVRFHPPIEAGPEAGRKALAQEAEGAVRSGHRAGMAPG
ncbi:MAG: 1-acyl-sn-glycerol-3-phosphate acyltransferase [Rhodobacteraceae bacterium]|nr:1-acyl-sn-glycerol-3-phosphate acyltransferase [Paracoccaceae bacterium]